MDQTSQATTATQADNKETAVASAPTLYGISNDQGRITKLCEPWNYQPCVPDFGADKKAYLAWRNKETTSHLLYLGATGVNPDVRPNNKTNQLTALRAIVADYDSNISDETAVERNVPVDLMPTWIQKTFSNGARLVWMFEKGVPFDDTITKRFGELVGEELRLKKLLPGLDEKPLGWFQPYKAWDVGTAGPNGWRRLSNKPLSTKVVYHWLVESAQKTDWGKKGEIKIPIDEVRDAIREKFGVDLPEIGGRINRFWTTIDVGENNTSAVVTEDGMICFSGFELFTPWARMLPELARKHKAEKIGAAVDGVWFDGSHYWKRKGGRFHKLQKEEVVNDLKVQHKLSARIKSHDDAHTEIEGAVHFVNNQRRVDGAMPLHYSEEETHTLGGRLYVNNSYLRLTQPADVKQEWGANGDFPWLSHFLDKCWDKTPVACVVPGKPPQQAKDIFNAWMRRFYLSALHGKLQRGHALYIAGPVNSGKSLLNYRVIGGAMGGHAEGSDFLSGDSNFNKTQVENSVWCIDDGTLTGSEFAHQRYTEIIKRHIANPFMSYHAKGVDQQLAAWAGRIVVTLNEDVGSIRMIPDLSQSMEDKLIVLKFADEKIAIPSGVEPIIRSELPFYLRWLVDNETPVEIMGDPRFGIHSYVDDRLRAKAMQAGGANDTLEVIALWQRIVVGQLLGDKEEGGVIARIARSWITQGYWEGNTSEWITEVNRHDSLRPLISGYKSVQIGIKLGTASRTPGSGVKDVSSAHKGGGKRWRIVLREDLRAKVNAL